MEFSIKKADLELIAKYPFVILSILLCVVLFYREKGHESREDALQAKINSMNEETIRLSRVAILYYRQQDSTDKDNFKTLLKFQLENAKKDTVYVKPN